MEVSFEQVKSIGVFPSSRSRQSNGGAKAMGNSRWCGLSYSLKKIRRASGCENYLKSHDARSLSLTENRRAFITKR